MVLIMLKVQHKLCILTEVTLIRTELHKVGCPKGLNQTYHATCFEPLMIVLSIAQSED